LPEALAAHGKETMAGLRRLYHSPIGIRVVVLPQLKKIDELLNNGEPYSKVLEQVRDLGLKELILFYKRASQYPRWVSKSPNPCGVIRCWNSMDGQKRSCIPSGAWLNMVIGLISGQKSTQPILAMLIIWIGLTMIPMTW